MASRDIQELHPAFIQVVKDWRKLCTFEKYKPLIYVTYRGNEEQMSLYDKGRSEPGKKVTNATAGKSWHQYGLAIDFAVQIGGKTDWEAIPLYKVMGHIGKSLGMKWGGDWRSIKDYGHLEYHPGWDIDEAYEATYLVGKDPRKLDLIYT